MLRHVAIVTPVYDDWESFSALLSNIASLYADFETAFHVIAVNDGSTVAPPRISELQLSQHGCIVEVEVLSLALNLGHQRAIAIGLCHAALRTDFDATIAMDSDGEDRPEDIRLLIAEAMRNPGYATLAGRTERSEGLLFRGFYALYKLVFHITTGRQITFGNYSLLRPQAVRRLAHMPELWNNLAGAIMRSGIPYVAVPTSRGRRYAGNSKMNMVGLVLHGLSAMSVYTDRIFVRLLFASGVLAVMAFLGIVTATVIRFGTSLAIPGWATTVVGDLAIILSQATIVVATLTLSMLAGRTQRPIVPIKDALTYVTDRQSWWADRYAAVAVLRASIS